MAAVEGGVPALRGGTREAQGGGAAFGDSGRGDADGGRGDWDAFYRRFLSAQNGKAAKAEKMLRGVIEWRSGLDLEGKMRAWRGIPDETKDSTFEGYQSGWYTAETAIGCPVYIERTGR